MIIEMIAPATPPEAFNKPIINPFLAVNQLLINKIARNIVIGIMNKPRKIPPR